MSTTTAQHPLLDETLLSFAQAARSLPSLRDQRPVNPSTIWRWASHGIRGVRLEYIKIGATAFTSREALGRFFSALSGDQAVSEGASTSVRPKQTTPERRRRQQHVEAELQKLDL